jgi:hypothetical protein
VNGEELEVTDLIDLKSSRIVTPRPPTLTSIPSLLSTFQNEWDALALETFTIRQQLQQTRQELATALYQHDAAIRVIARLTKERDEARDALSKVTIGTGGGDAMQVDSQGLPEALAAKVDETQERYALRYLLPRRALILIFLQALQNPSEAPRTGRLGHCRGHREIRRRICFKGAVSRCNINCC